MIDREAERLVNDLQMSALRRVAPSTKPVRSEEIVALRHLGSTNT